MGSIIERPLSDGSITYQAMVKIPGAKAAVKSFKDKTLAQNFVDDIENQRKAAMEKRTRRRKEARSPDEIAGANQELWEDQWLKTALKLYGESDHIAHRLKQSSRTIIKFGGDVKLGEINKAWVRDYIKFARKQKVPDKGTLYSWATIVDHMRTVSAAMAWQAEEMEAAGQKLPFSLKMVPAGWDVKRDRRLSPDEARAITRNLILKRTATGPQLLRMVRLALNTAARLQELVLAEWSEFDLDLRYWIIPAGHTKANKTRMVPLNKRAIRALSAMKLLRIDSSPRVFHGIGSPASASNMFTKLFKRLAIKDLRFHDFRHDAISQMVLKQRHLSVFEIMKIVGHGSLDMLDRYTNLRGDELAAKLID